MIAMPTTAAWMRCPQNHALRKQRSLARDKHQVSRKQGKPVGGKQTVRAKERAGMEVRKEEGEHWAVLGVVLVVTGNSEGPWGDQ